MLGFQPPSKIYQSLSLEVQRFTLPLLLGKCWGNPDPCSPLLPAQGPCIRQLRTTPSNPSPLPWAAPTFSCSSVSFTGLQTLLFPPRSPVSSSCSLPPNQLIRSFFKALPASWTATGSYFRPTERQTVNTLYPQPFSWSKGCTSARTSPDGCLPAKAE